MVIFWGVHGGIATHFEKLVKGRMSKVSGVNKVLVRFLNGKDIKVLCLSKFYVTGCYFDL